MANKLRIMGRIQGRRSLILSPWLEDLFDPVWVRPGPKMMAKWIKIMLIAFMTTSGRLFSTLETHSIHSFATRFYHD
jgi:hypothetical protein